MMAAVMQMRQPQKEWEAPRDKIWATHTNPPQNNFLLKKYGSSSFVYQGRLYSFILASAIEQIFIK